jgi:hypothetical protein
VYKSTATFCVFEETAEGTWVLPPSWTPSISNFLDRIPVKCCGEKQETVVQLRSGDQILTKGGRWSIDFFITPATPNIASSTAEHESDYPIWQKHVAKHSHYSQLEVPSTLVPRPLSPGCLHLLLGLNGPQRAVVWARAAYEYDESHVVLQASICQNYRNTFETYGSLISPLILLKAVKYAFPSMIVEKKVDGLKYPIKGIRLRESQPQTSYLPEQDQAQGTCPRLKEILFNTEDVSPDVLEGMETPVWRVMDDSQAMPTLYGNEDIPGEEQEILEQSDLEYDTSTRSSLGELRRQTKLTSTPPKTEMPPSRTPNEGEESLRKSISDHLTAINAISGYDPGAFSNSDANAVLDDRRTQSLAASINSTLVSSTRSVSATMDEDASTPPQRSTDMIRSASIQSTLEMSKGANLKDGKKLDTASKQNEPRMSLAVSNESADHNPRHHIGQNSSDKTCGDVESPRKITRLKEMSTEPVSHVSDAHEKTFNIRAETRSRGQEAEQLPKASGKRSRQASSRSSMPLKKTKTSDRRSPKDAQISQDFLREPDPDGDTIIVESRSIPKKAHSTDRNGRSLNRNSEASFHSFEALPSSVPRKQRAPASLLVGMPSSTKSKFSRTSSGDPPRTVFSSTTEIDTKKNTMAFFHECGGKATKNIVAATMLCVGSNAPLKKTANLVLAVCMGLDVVTDKWLVDSHRKGFLLDADQYLPKDPQREREWGFKLRDATARGKLQGHLTSLLSGVIVHFTHGVKALLGQNFRDFKTVAVCMGADTVRNGLPNGKEGKDVLILGTPNEPQTLEASRMGFEVWSKDLLVMGALRGEILRTGEFAIAKPMKEE